MEKSLLHLKIFVKTCSSSTSNASKQCLQYHVTVVCLVGFPLFVCLYHTGPSCSANVLLLLKLLKSSFVVLFLSFQHWRGGSGSLPKSPRAWEPSHWSRQRRVYLPYGWLSELWQATSLFLIVKPRILIKLQSSSPPQRMKPLLHSTLGDWQFYLAEKVIHCSQQRTWAQWRWHSYHSPMYCLSEKLIPWNHVRQIANFCLVISLHLGNDKGPLWLPVCWMPWRFI